MTCAQWYRHTWFGEHIAVARQSTEPIAFRIAVGGRQSAVAVAAQVEGLDPALLRLSFVGVMFRVCQNRDFLTGRLVFDVM